MPRDLLAQPIQPAKQPRDLLANVPPPPPPKEPGLFQKIGASAKKRFGEVKKLLPGGEYSGQQGLNRTLFQVAGQGAGFVNDTAGEVVIATGKTLLPKAAEKAIARTTEKAVSAVANTGPVKAATKKYSELKEKNPALARDLNAATNLVSLLPVGKGGQVATKGAGKAVEVAGEAVAAGGRATSATGRKLFRTAITPNVGEAERILNYEAKAPFLTRAKAALKGTILPESPRLRSDTALEKGIFGFNKNIGVQSKREADALWDTKIAPAVKASPVRVSKDEMFAPIAQRIERTTEPGKKKAYQEAFDAIQDDYKDVVDFSLDEAQSLKRELDEFTPEKMFRGKNVANEYKVLQKDMADAIRSKTYEALDDVNIKQDYLDWGNLSELQKVGVKAISEAGTKGGFGGFWTTIWDAATTPVKTTGGQVVYRVGNKLEFVGRKGIKTFGQFLQGKGFKRPGS